MEILSALPSRLDVPKKTRGFRLFLEISFFLIVALLVTSCRLPFASSPPPCVEPVLKIGTRTFRIETIEPARDGSLAVPQDTPNVAHWVDGTNINYVFGLSALASNTSLLESLQSGETATITWANCNSTSYILSTVEAGVPDWNSLLDQSVSQISIFIQPEAPEPGMVVRGSLTGEQISTFSTPDPSEIQAEISLLETTSLTDNTTIRVGVSILNYGSSVLEVTPDAISLIPPGGSPLAPTAAEPALPKAIAPGTTETFYFTFPRPSTNSATLKIFTVEYEVEGY